MLWDHSLPSGGIFFGLDGKEDSLALTPAGFGMDYYLSDSLSVGLQIRPRIDFHDNGKERYESFGIEIPFGIAFHHSYGWY